MRNTYITKYKNLKSTKEGENINLMEWLKDETHKNSVLYLRTLINKEERQKFKSTMPCVTISGTFLNRKRDSLIKHSGFICIDIDGNENQDIEDFSELRNELGNIINVAYSGLSVGGNGVFCLIPIKNTEKHKEHFEALQLCFKNLGIIIDSHCSDVGRLRICSYDPDAYFNENAAVFNEFIEYKINARPHKIPKVNLIPKVNSIIDSKQKNDTTEKRVMKIIEEVNLSGTDMTDTYENWFKIGCALSNHFGEQGRDMFHLLSKHHPKYSPEATDNKFDGFLKSPANDPIRIGTFFFIAESHGFK
jgi:hypothetical protein